MEKLNKLSFSIQRIENSIFEDGADYLLSII